MTPPQLASDGNHTADPQQDPASGSQAPARTPDSQNFEQNEMAVVSHDQVLENLLGNGSH